MSKELSVEFSIGKLRDLALNLIPAGDFVKSLIDFRIDLQKERTIHFMELLQKDFERFLSTGGEIQENKIFNEHFIDCFETIWRKVIITKSEEKIRYYKNILFRQMLEPDEYNSFLKLLTYVDKLNDIQIFILSKVYRGTQESNALINSLDQYKYFKGRIRGFDSIETEIPEVQHTLDVIRRHQEIIKRSVAQLNGDKDEIIFYIFELLNFGFIRDANEEPHNYYYFFEDIGSKPISNKPIFLPTQMGIKILEFIHEYCNDEEE
jgi:hypothetical protein